MIKLLLFTSYDVNQIPKSTNRLARICFSEGYSVCDVSDLKLKDLNDSAKGRKP